MLQTTIGKSDKRIPDALVAKHIIEEGSNFTGKVTCNEESVKTPILNAAWQHMLENMMNPCSTEASSSTSGSSGSTPASSTALVISDGAAGSTTSTAISPSCGAKRTIISVCDEGEDGKDKRIRDITRQPSRTYQPELRNIKRGSAELALVAANDEKSKEKALNELLNNMRARSSYVP